jgi:hypothetical protein
LVYISVTLPLIQTRLLLTASYKYIQVQSVRSTTNSLALNLDQPNTMGDPFATASSASLQSSSTYDSHREQQTSSTQSGFSVSTVTSTTNPFQTAPTSQPTDNLLNNADDAGFDHLAHGVKAAVFVMIVFAVIVCIGAYFFYRRRYRQRQQIQNRNGDIRRGYGDPVNGERGLPLHNLQTPPAVHMEGEDSPPQYAEVVPPQHQRIAGGITNVREEEEGIISDGKTPLSEIAFEDVVLERTGSDASGSGSSSRSPGGEFGRHHGMGGDTSGHTNS